MKINKSITEDVSHDWFGEMSNGFRHGPHVASGRPEVNRDSFSEVILVGRLRKATRCLKNAIPSRNLARRADAAKAVEQAAFSQI